MTPDVGERLPVTDRDEAHHEHGGTPGWSERLTFAFFDPASSIGGVARMTFAPVERAAEGSINLFMPGDAIVTVLAREKIERPGSNVGRITFERLDAMSRWRVRCRDVALIFPNARAGGLPRAGERTGAAAQLDLEIAFDAWMPPSGTVGREKHTDELNFVQVTSHGRFEQAGRASGRVRVGTRQATVDGTAMRDRVWGASVPGTDHASSWLAAAFDPAFSFGLRTATVGTTSMRSGWICRDGEVRPLTSFRLSTDLDGRTVTGVRLEMDGPDGARDEVIGEVVATVPLREGGARIQQSMLRYRIGGREALGLAEFVEPG